MLGSHDSECDVCVSVSVCLCVCECVCVGVCGCVCVSECVWVSYLHPVSQETHRGRRKTTQQNKNNKTKTQQRHPETTMTSSYFELQNSPSPTENYNT